MQLPFLIKNELPSVNITLNRFVSSSFSVLSEPLNAGAELWFVTVFAFAFAAWFAVFEEETLKWLSNGAMPTDTVRNILSKAGIMKKFHDMKQGK